MKEYVLKGLSCANCAAQIEQDVNKLSGVISATVNFMTSTLQVEINKEFSGDIQKVIETIVHHHEPEILVIDKKALSKESVIIDDDKYKWKLTKLISGAMLFTVGLVVGNLFDLSFYVTLPIFLISYLLLGGDIVLKAMKNIVRGKFFDENFLMSIATIGAFAIGQVGEAVAVMLFYKVGEYFQEFAVRRSKRSIAHLMGIRPDYANLKKDGGITKVAPEDVKVGDVIIVKPGEKIPLDGVVLEGEAMLDTTALTGESTPRKASTSDIVLSGCINQNGVLTIKVTQIFGESTVAKIINLVESAASKKAPVENFITKFARYYTPVVVSFAVLLAMIPPLFFGGMWSDWIHRGLIFLVISCPCALVISIPLGFFGGIGKASRKGILVKGSQYLEALNDLDTVVFDKTGTITKGTFKVTEIQSANGFDKDELLEIAAYVESYSNHPIALSILQEYGKEITKDGLTEYREMAGYGVHVKVTGKEVFAGNSKLMTKMDIAFNETEGLGTKVYVAVNHVFAGCIIISDEIKSDSYRAIASLKSKGVHKTIMLTGDDPQIAAVIAKEVNIDDYYGGLLPHQKVEKVEQLSEKKRTKGKLAFVGDGINDAPVLAMADVGVAMGGLGSDAAIEAADIVLMTDEPSKLAEAMDIAKLTKRIVWQNIIFALGVKAIFLLLGALGVASLWEAVFADVGVSILAIMNAMRVIRS